MHDWTKDWYTTWYVLRGWWKWLLIISVAVFLLLRAAPNHAYVILQHDGYDAAWEDPTVEMNIELSSCPNLSDYTFYGPCRPGSTRRAMEDWNDIGSNFRFVEQTGVTSDVCNHHDGINTIGWSDNFCGERLSGKRAARTISTYRYENGVPIVAERDIILDLNYPWTKLSFQITILHELGHVIGLGHPNDHGQSVPAIMNNPIFETTIQQDDIDGVQALYGGIEKDVDYGGKKPPSFKGFLEIPSPSQIVSGIGMISGWVCEAESVEAIIRDSNGDELPISPVRLLYGGERLDTQEMCGDVNNGFGVVINWQRIAASLGEKYTIQIRVDGEVFIDFGYYVFYVGGLGEEFFRGRYGQGYKIADFPREGDVTYIEWQVPQQGFAILRTEKPSQ